MSTNTNTNTITVTGCGDCPMEVGEEGYRCYAQPNIIGEPYFWAGLFETCPLKTNSLTIQLKQDGTE